MPITLRNKAVEEGIREIGRRTGEGPSAVIRRLVEQELGGAVETEEERIARRLKVWDELLAERPVMTDEDRAAIDQAMEDMYDENGLPK